MSCSDCGGTVIEYDSAAGNGFCVKCGTVIEENLIVNELAFGESSTGAAIVHGSFVGQGATHSRFSGPYGNRDNCEPREQTIANANKKIHSLANILRLSEFVSLAATRLYTLALDHKFTKGRKSLNVIAVCLYVACRQKECRNYMLIDFSDLLQVNVFELGHTYLQLVQALNLRLPLVDPSHYISRFAALLEFGDETHKVATDAVRLVQRFDRDWMSRGRRPAGICGAALLLAARMNNFRRSVQEIIQVVKIADTTLRKRLDEFKKTPSGNLTLADFRNVWLEEEMDPPAFVKGRLKEEKKKKKKKKKKQADTTPLDPAIFRQGIFKDTFDNVPLFIPDPTDPNYNIDPALLRDSSGSSPPQSPTTVPTAIKDDTTSLQPPPVSAVDETASSVLEQEVSTFLQNQQGTLLTEALDEAELRRLAQITVQDELLGLDEDELDRFLLTEEEVRVKERVWVELNRDYLEAIAARKDQQESASATNVKSRKRRKTTGSTTKPRDASTAHAATAAESVKKMLRKNPKYSKRINYEALKDLFVESGGLPSFAANMGLSEDKDEADLYQIAIGDDNRDMVFVQEVGVANVREKMEDDEDDKSEDDGVVNWEDTFEQEF